MIDQAVIQMTAFQTRTIAEAVKGNELISLCWVSNYGRLASYSPYVLEPRNCRELLACSCPSLISVAPHVKQG